MRVLLINPKTGDFGRAAAILRVYRTDHMGEPFRSRYNSVVYAGDHKPNAVAVWHSKNQITLHFGEKE